MHTRIGDICRMIMVIVVLLLPGSVWIPDAKGAGLDETFRIERRGTIPAEVDGTADDEEQPIMTIGYRPREYNDNPLLGNRYQKPQSVASQYGVPRATAGDVLLVIVVVIAVIALVVLCLFLLSIVIEDILN